MLTNYETIKGRINRLKELEEMFESGYINRFTKKEQAVIRKEFDKLTKNLSGIKEMGGIPDVMFVIDIKLEQNAISEAHKLGIPVVAIVDTNCDPDLVDFPIPGNDDAIRACQLVAVRIADAVNEGRQLREDDLVDEIKAAGDDVPVEAIVEEEIDLSSVEPVIKDED